MQQELQTYIHGQHFSWSFDRQGMMQCTILCTIAWGTFNTCR